MPLVAAAAALAAGCGGSAKPEGEAVAAPGRPACPAAWKPGWQRLANRIGAPVYCPSWMPDPLDGKIGGEWTDIRSVDRDGSYLISFLLHEGQSGDVHVNFRGYPGRTKIPRCDAVDGGRRTRVPCFSDARGSKRVAGIHATVYTVNQDADQWHVLYAWRRNGSLYTVSEHVTPRVTYARAVRHLNRLVRGLVLVRPA
jgi:hypothetical protein